MTNPRLKVILHEVMEDTKKEKLSLIQDVIKNKRLLYGLGEEDQIGAILKPGDTFDTLYDRASIEALQLTIQMQEIRINALMKKRMDEISDKK